MYSEPRLRPAPLNAIAQAAGTTTPPALRIGMIGLGTVGMGTWTVLKRNQSLIAARAGRAVEIVAIAVRDRVRAAEKLGDLALQNVELSGDPHYVATHPDVDVLVEVAGGTGPARGWVQAALAAGKHVVTANKALLAVHGEDLAETAAAHGRQLAYEAAVAGSIPIIKTLREALAANRIDSVTGILNGTSNYILTRMRDAGLGFAQALAEAQQLGYAEADPSFDVDGIDAAHKLSLLAANAFGMAVDFDSVHIEGIRDLQRADIAAAAELGYAVKLLATARRQGAAVELRVHPALVPERHALAHVDGATNGVLVHGDASGPAFYSGAGAGAEPTASAVVADLIDLARLPASHQDRSVPTLGTRLHADDAAPAVLPISEVVTPQLLRVACDTGLCEASTVRALEKSGLQVLRRKWMHAEDAAPALVLLTAPVVDSLAANAVQRLQARNGVIVRRLRVHSLD
ncbi:homoserine dehydrogenase [Diaphorobacter sp. HDW4A]|uniref:homoserine dehydrogenase n=1 Tax=Diaphorobacter sp. HDW4A TaxID=2714924 RepID=UPI00140E2FF2|nr:homoserine dehydrogenase [Diaphorobacter sp. HDW4A]QIL82530.1 homoserine dehydrogenase [Diaphorobacter sp. HDW4A]